MFQIQSIYSENAYGLVTNFARIAQWLPITDLQQRGFAVLLEDAFRGKSRYIFRFCSHKFIQKSYRNIK